MAEQPPNPNPPNPEPPLPPAPAPDPTALLSELQKSNQLLAQRLEQQEQVLGTIAQQFQQGAYEGVQQGPARDDDWSTIQQGWLALKTSQNPADRALAAALENQARATAKLNEELAATRRELGETRQAQQYGIPGEDLSACQKYLESGDAGNLKAAHRLVLMDKQEAAAKGPGAAPVPGATTPPSASPPVPRPSPASPPQSPAAPTAEGPIKQSEYVVRAAENLNGRPTPRALELIRAVSEGRITPVPG